MKGTAKPQRYVPLWRCCLCGWNI